MSVSWRPGDTSLYRQQATPSQVTSGGQRISFPATAPHDTSATVGEQTIKETIQDASSAPVPPRQRTFTVNLSLSSLTKTFFKILNRVIPQKEPVPSPVDTSHPAEEPSPPTCKELHDTIQGCCTKFRGILDRYMAASAKYDNAKKSQQPDAKEKLAEAKVELAKAKAEYRAMKATVNIGEGPRKAYHEQWEMNNGTFAEKIKADLQADKISQGDAKEKIKNHAEQAIKEKATYNQIHSATQYYALKIADHMAIDKVDRSLLPFLEFEAKKTIKGTEQPMFMLEDFVVKADTNEIIDKPINPAEVSRLEDKLLKDAGLE